MFSIYVYTSACIGVYACFVVLFTSGINFHTFCLHVLVFCKVLQDIWSTSKCSGIARKHGYTKLVRASSQSIWSVGGNLPLEPLNCTDLWQGYFAKQTSVHSTSIISQLIRMYIFTSVQVISECPALQGHSRDIDIVLAKALSENKYYMSKCSSKKVFWAHTVTDH